ncbi:MAG: cobyric acid synthase, partial [Candidatus Adiutrix sp.]
KSQNMSLNSFVTEEGHEMGRAQVAQAEAASLKPSSLMNPILLKPTTNSKSQVIVNGKVLANMSAVEYYAYKEQLRPKVLEAFNTLAARHDIIIIEGAGSPAEINLMDGDFVNMGMAAMAQAPVILAGDIDRGGVFAALYGTVKLLPKEDRARICGLIINKFRGDLEILKPGLNQIESLLGLPVLGVIPYGQFAIDEEDSLTDRFKSQGCGGQTKIAVLRLPKISNFTDFAVFDSLPQASLIYADEPGDLLSADLIILPGSKNTIEDMRYLHESGLAKVITEQAQKGRVVCGICGGFQMLGRTINDPFGVESDLKTIDGLALLDLETHFAQDKHTSQSAMTIRSAPGVLSGTEGVVLNGYEIHMGRTTMGPKSSPLGDGGPQNTPFGAVNPHGNVFGSYLHGFFDNLKFTRTLLNNIQKLKGFSPSAERCPIDETIESYQDFKEREYDRLADMVEANLPFEKLLRLL